MTSQTAAEHAEPAAPRAQADNVVDINRGARPATEPQPAEMPPAPAA